MTMPVSADRGPASPDPAHTGADHDESLVAGLAAGDLDPREAAVARALVEECPACAALEADLAAIMAATAALPPPRRTRDFRLTEADAARLRPTGWRRLLEPFARPRTAFTRPLAGGLVALGLAGLVLAAVPTGPSAASVPTSAGTTNSIGVTAGAGDAAAPAAASAPNQAFTAPSPPALPSPFGAFGFPSAAPSIAGTGSQPQPAATAAGNVPQPAASTAANVPPPGTASNGKELAPSPEPAALSNTPAATQGPSPLAIGSIVLLVLGLGLFALRWVARRPLGPADR
jgi:hypothetical protein